MAENELCALCNSGVSEDLEHFLLECKALNDIHQKYFAFFESHVFLNSNFNINFIELSPGAKIKFLNGDLGYLFDKDIGTFYDIHGKMLVNECFDKRSELLNQ